MKEDSKPKNNRKSKVIKVILTVLAGIVLLVAFALSISILGGLDDLRNPVSGLLPVVAFGALMMGVALLLVGIWRKGKRLFNAVTWTSLGVVAVALLLFSISPVVNRQILSETFHADLKSMKAYAARGITFDMPSAWYTNDLDGTSYYYPSGTDNASMGMVTVVEHEGLWFFTKGILLNDAYREMAKELKSGTEGIVDVAESDVTVANAPARRLDYSVTNDGVRYEAVTYLIMTDHQEAVSFTFAHPNEMPRYFEESITAVVNSIQRWQ